MNKFHMICIENRRQEHDPAEFPKNHSAHISNKTFE